MKPLASALTLSTALGFTFITPAKAAVVQGDLRPQRLGAAQNPFLLANRITANGSAAAPAERTSATAVVLGSSVGTGAVVTTGAGSLQITGSNTFMGATLVVGGQNTLTGGTLRLDSPSAFQLGTGLTVEPGFVTGLVNATGSLGINSDVTSTTGTLITNWSGYDPANALLWTQNLPLDDTRANALSILGTGQTLGVVNTGVNGVMTLADGTIVITRIGAGTLGLSRAYTASGTGTWVLNPGSLLQVNEAFPRHVIIDSAGNVVSLPVTTSAGSLPVPEPAAGLLAVLGACAAAARRKRSR